MVKVYDCKLTDCEVLSDSYPDLQGTDMCEGVPECLLVVQATMVVPGQISVYDGNAFGGDDDEDDDDEPKVNGIVNDFNLQKIDDMDKKTFKGMFMKHIKQVMKAGKLKKAAKESDEGKAALKSFQERSVAALKWILGHYKDIELYMNGDCMDDEEQPFMGAWVFGWWNPSAEYVQAPQMVLWKDSCSLRKL